MSTNIAKGIEIARKATEYDVSGDYVKASDLYIKSLDFFLIALKSEKDPSRKELIRSKMKEYLDRAEFIKSNFLRPSNPTAPTAPTAPSAPAHFTRPAPAPAPALAPAPAPRMPASGSGGGTGTGGGSGGYYEQLIMQSMRYDDIVQECRRQRIKFTDPLFKADTSSLFKGQPSKDALELSQKVVWMRATEKMGGRVAMFQSAIDPCDVVQGSLGDCWFL